VGGFEDTAALLTSELVTNALLHARSAPELRVILVAGRLRVSVSDDTPLPPTPKRYGTDAATGRGLLLVETMASAWGTDVSGDGKVVWFELASADEDHATAFSESRGSSPKAPPDGRRGSEPARGSRPSSSPRSSRWRSRSRGRRAARR